jgi:hypothetical protein
VFAGSGNNVSSDNTVRNNVVSNSQAGWNVSGNWNRSSKVTWDNEVYDNCVWASSREPEYIRVGRLSLEYQEGVAESRGADSGSVGKGEIGRAISAVSARDVRDFFEHCGYGTPVQSLLTSAAGSLVENANAQSSCSSRPDVHGHYTPTTWQCTQNTKRRELRFSTPLTEVPM